MPYPAWKLARVAEDPEVEAGLRAGHPVTKLYRMLGYNDPASEKCVSAPTFRRACLLVCAIKQIDRHGHPPPPPDPTFVNFEPQQVARIMPDAPATYPDELRAAQETLAAEEPVSDEVERLRAEVAMLRERLKWAQHSGTVGGSGGVAHLVRGDDHYTDRAHMGRVCAELEAKSILAMQQYRPQRIVIVYDGDCLIGRGIYKEQQMDSVVQTGQLQRAVACVLVRRFYDRLIEAFPDAEIVFRFLLGNHDRIHGEPMTPDLVVQLRGLGVPAVYHGMEAVLNLSDAGTYNVLIEHGFGYSRISPSSDAWWRAMQDRLLRMATTWTAEQRIRRVVHGHTHWFNIGLQRIPGYYVDTVGGCQRNERVKIGLNSRPCGWILYVSTAGHAGILDPIGIEPSPETLEADLTDVHLLQRNMAQCAELAPQYDAMMEAAGAMAVTAPEGR